MGYGGFGGVLSPWGFLGCEGISVGRLQLSWNDQNQPQPCFQSLWKRCEMVGMQRVLPGQRQARHFGMMLQSWGINLCKSLERDSQGMVTAPWSLPELRKSLENVLMVELLELSCTGPGVRLDDPYGSLPNLGILILLKIRSGIGVTERWQTAANSPNGESPGSLAFPSQEKKSIAPIPRIPTFPEVFHELMSCFSITHEDVPGMDLFYFWEQVEASPPKSVSNPNPPPLTPGILCPFC